MPPHAHGLHIKDVDWKSGLSLPKARARGRDVEEYPTTVLGELAFRIRELYCRDNDHPRPTSVELAQTARLVGLLSQEVQGAPLYKRSPDELELINYLVTPRVLWREVVPFHRAIQTIVAERFAEDGGAIAALLGRAWSGGEGSVSVYYLQQIAIHLCMVGNVHKEVAKVVASSIPSPRRAAMSASLTGGAFALLAMCGQLGEERASRLLLGVGLEALAQAEMVDKLFVLDPLSRPTEYRFASYFLADLLRAHLSVHPKEAGSEWAPTDDEVLDITRSWLEGSHFPVRNFLRHCNALRRDLLAPSLKELYYRNGIRNFLRLELRECEDPWFLMNYLSDRDARATAGRDIILVAMSSGDHNDAFSERSWEYEAIRSAGDSQGWEFDYVEVRDSVELGYHILRHHDQGSRVAVLHHLGHGSREGAEYGHLEREGRSQLDLATLCTNRDHAEVCSIAAAAVDTWVLHHCSTAAPDTDRTRKISNLREALHKATDGKVNVTGLRGNDAFDELTHRRDSRGRVIFTGRAVWMGAQRAQRRTRGAEG